MNPLAILFLPFIIFEGFIGGIARSLNLAPPPQVFTQLSSGQGQSFPQLPPVHNFISSPSISNIEEETVERDERGFVIRRVIKRNVREE